MKGFSIYNNGNGWRIEVVVSHRCHVLTVKKAIELSQKLEYSINETFSREANGEKHNREDT